MNNLQFSLCTYNIGSSVNDYYQLRKHLEPSIKITGEAEEDAFRSQYAEVQKSTASLLTNKARAYCLQEVVDEERPLIRSLKEKNFEIVHSTQQPGFDTAIALDKERFKDITNHSIEVQITQGFNKDAAIATATDVLSREKITFVSAHVPGFDFTKEVTVEEASYGDIYCQAIAQKLAEIGSDTIQIIGADMNANPEKWNPRFQIFSKKGFKLHRTNSPTNVNSRDSRDQMREIDFLFTKTTTSIWQRIKSLFVSMRQVTISLKDENSIGWNVEDNASDHLPVFLNVSPQIKISKVSQLWNATYQLLSSCFRPKQQAA